MGSRIARFRANEAAARLPHHGPPIGKRRPARSIDIAFNHGRRAAFNRLRRNERQSLRESVALRKLVSIRRVLRGATPIDFGLSVAVAVVIAITAWGATGNGPEGPESAAAVHA
jgi:hypothetical protein